MRRALYLFLFLAVVALGSGMPARAVDSPTPKQHLTVFAAASLAEAFKTIGAAFEHTHPGLTAVLSRVAAGEADAGIVYVSDIRAAADRVEAVAIPAQYNVVAQYPIAVLKQGGNTESATAFVNFVMSAPGQTLLKEFGFRAP